MKFLKLTLLNLINLNAGGQKLLLLTISLRYRMVKEISIFYHIEKFLKVPISTGASYKGSSSQGLAFTYLPPTCNNPLTRRTVSGGTKLLCCRKNKQGDLAVLST